MSLPGESWSKLIAQSPTVFYAPDKDTEVTFLVNSISKVHAVDVPDFPHSEPWGKIRDSVRTIGDQTVYLRGSMNNWSTQNTLKALNKETHETSLSLVTGSYEFKVATEDWRTVDLGQDDQTSALVNEGSINLTGAGGNIKLRVVRDSVCTFKVDSSIIVRPKISVSCKAS
jgi:hypothetical protein